MISTYIVYKHTNLINGKIYFGITVHGDNPNKRWQNGKGYIENEKFFKDILEYGWNNFSHEIIAKNLSEIEAIQIEASLIKKYNTVENGYNNSYGFNVHGQESRKKISQSLKGKNKSKESIDKQIKTKVEQNGFKCGFDPIESKATKKVRCKETGDIFGSVQEAINWCHSSKVSECCSGLRQHAGHHPITGQLLSWEYVEKDANITIRCIEKYITKKQIKKVLCVETKQIYKNASEASRQTKISVSSILRVCNKERKTAGGYHWEYIEEDIK